MSVLIVDLTPEEIEYASDIGIARNVNHRKNGTIDGSVTKRPSTEIDVEGAIGEYAVSKALHLNWVNQLYTEEEWKRIRRTKEDNDVGNLGVRTRRGTWGRLILHPHDDDNRPFVFVLLGERTATLVGWIIAKDGKKKEYWQDVGYGRWAFYVSQDTLSQDWDELINKQNEFGRL